MTTIAVTGAAGQLGRYVIAKLKEKIAPSDIVAIVRNTSKSKNLGVAVRQADYTDPGALGAAMQGIVPSTEIWIGRRNIFRSWRS